MTAADSVFCNNCGDQIEGEPPIADDLAQRKPCPRCGSTARRVNLQASGFFGAAGGRATLTLTRKTIRKAVEKNCVLMIDYGIATVGGAWASYWTNYGLSVVLSFFVAVVTLLLGLYMLREVITITIERLPEGQSFSGDDQDMGITRLTPRLACANTRTLRNGKRYERRAKSTIVTTTLTTRNAKGAKPGTTTGTGTASAAGAKSSIQERLHWPDEKNIMQNTTTPVGTAAAATHRPHVRRAADFSSVSLLASMRTCRSSAAYRRA